MNVILSPEAEKLINEKLATGEYKNASEIVDEALRALQVRRARDYEEAVQGIRRGLESAECGEGRPANEFFDEMRRKHGIPR